MRGFRREGSMCKGEKGTTEKEAAIRGQEIRGRKERRERRKKGEVRKCGATNR